MQQDISHQSIASYATTVIQDDFDIRMLAQVLRALRKGFFFNDKWESLGLELGLYKGTLTSIKANHKDVEACLRESLTKWLQRADGVDDMDRRPSWSTLSDALEGINNKTTADFIRRQAYSGNGYSYRQSITRQHMIINRYTPCSNCVLVISTLLILTLAVILPVYLKYSGVSNMIFDEPLNTKREKRNNSVTSKVPSNLFSIPTLEERIWIEGETGEDVVDLCISKLINSTIFPNDNSLMKRIAHVMSNYGKPSFALETDGGIWQVSIFAFRDTYDTKTHIRLPRKYAALRHLYGVEWTNIRRDHLAIPMYSAIAARLYLSNFAKAIPPAYKVEEQADYWWDIYMMNHESRIIMNHSDFTKTV